VDVEFEGHRPILREVEQRLRDRLSSARKTWMTFTSRVDRSASSTSMGNCFRSRCETRSRTLPQHKDLRSASRASPVRLRRRDSPAHPLVRRSVVRVGSHLPRSKRMHGLDCGGHVGCCRASRELCSSRWRTGANHIRRPEEPANTSSFTHCHLGKAEDVLPDFLRALRS
jgi:hypothetical protein